MAERVVIVRSGDHLVSLPFVHIDEILGADRIVPLEDLPKGAAISDSGAQQWVFSRGAWYPVQALLPDSDVPSRPQIVVVRDEDHGVAFAVQQVVGIETSGDLVPFPEAALPYVDLPLAGIRFRKSGPVLELDLSRLISLDSKGR